MYLFRLLIGQADKKKSIIIKFKKKVQFFLNNATHQNDASVVVKFIRIIYQLLFVLSKEVLIEMGFLIDQNFCKGLRSQFDHLKNIVLKNNLPIEIGLF